ncbi:hypothetical protein TRAPUB_11060 [Trametes pubescens]|uniref:Uncharacterized protein n=1 Tax=Trametes pubescens TaxID=154538 RepID=A0A1M2VXQ3_TRAPU|nr:hypothetical protein TRAPUB_11060 [Trametes pubescens]
MSSSVTTVEGFARRVEHLSDYACTTNCWFSISMVPRKTDWAVIGGDPKTTALAYMDKAMNLWVVGRVQTLNVYIGSLDGNPTVRLAVELLRDIDEVAHADILRLVRRDTMPRAGSTMRMVSAGGPEGHAMLRRAYDARTEYKSKNEMPRVDITTFNVGDLVLAECWFVKKEAMGATTAFFSFRGISLLEEGERGKTETVPVNDVQFPWSI